MLNKYKQRIDILEAKLQLWEACHGGHRNDGRGKWLVAQAKKAYAEACGLPSEAS